MSQRIERRGNPRVSPKGTVIVHAGDYVLRGRVTNFSRGGMLIRTRTTAPERLLGSNVELEIRLDGGTAGWLQLRARLLRIGAVSLALRFDDVSASFGVIVDRMIAASTQHDRALSLVLVDGDEARRVDVASAFRGAGCAVIDVGTPLEAITRLGESAFEPDVIAIADSSPAAISDDLRRFVATEHPRARLVMIGDGTTAPLGITHWLSSADPDHDLAARVREVLLEVGSA